MDKQYKREARQLTGLSLMLIGTWLIVFSILKSLI